MRRILLSLLVALAACTPSPQKAAMPSPSPVPADTIRSSGETSSDGQQSDNSGSVTSAATGQNLYEYKQAAQGPIPEAVSAAGDLLPTPPADLTAEAEGRRTLSIAFVRVGPDGHLTVNLRDGRVLVLRNVVMRAKDYCGVQVSGRPARARYCGEYAEVEAARPGGVQVTDEPDPAVSISAKPTS